MFVLHPRLFSLMLTASLLTRILAIPEPNTIGFKFRKQLKPKSTAESSSLRTRQDGTVNADITNFYILYMINVTIGSNNQELGLQLDTGSSDLWLPSSDSDICSYGAPYCVDYGSFNANTSTTFVEDDDFGYFYISYVDGTAIQGIYFNDTLNIEGSSIPGATMALALSASRDIGIMGIGFTENESSNDPTREEAGLGAPFTYPSVLDNMVTAGLITSKSYSLWLDNVEDNTGTILFGGVDTEKYTGSLVALPIQPDTQTGSRTSFTVAWTGLSINTGSDSLDFSPSSPQPIILDSGTTLTYLPDDIANNIFNGLGVTTDPSVGQVLPCTTVANDYSFTYTFGGTNGASITVPLSELLIPLIDGDTGEPYTGMPPVPNGPQLCQFGINSAGDAPLLFGDTFLRSAYVVYDLDNFEIGIAQLNIGATASDDGDQISEIMSSNGIPGVSSTASEATVSQTFTGLPLGTQGGTAEGTETGLATASDTFGGAGYETVSRSATFDLSTSGTVPPSVYAAGATGGSSSGRSSGSASATRTSAGASGTSGAAASSSTGAAARMARVDGSSIGTGGLLSAAVVVGGMLAGGLLL